MAEKKLPLCFISYCHENADFDSIEAFQNQIERIANNSFKVIRDKSNIQPGDKISDHEDEIRRSDIVILLCTPQYKDKVANRAPGGVYREYGIILERYHSYINKIKSGGNARPFALIPILFSGSHSSAILSDISDNLYLDFTKFRTVRGKSGSVEVPHFVAQQHRAAFSEIRSKFASVRSGIEKSFSDDYDFWLNLLFLEEKHEALRGKYKFHKLEDLLNDLFVKTRSYNRIVDGDKCILIGRKGSGKSTIVDHFHIGNSDRFKSPIDIIVDNFDLGLLYNYVFTAPHSSDLREVMRVETFFEAVWRIYIYYQCIYKLVEEEEAGKNVNDLSPEINDLRPVAESKRELKWSQFIFVCEGVQAYVNEVIQSAKPGPTFYSEIAERLSIDAIIGSFMKSETISALTKCVAKCTRQFVFSLDGFDQRFEDFRTANIQMSTSEEDEKKRIEFEIAWLKGLLRTVLELRAGDKVAQEKVSFCITIPQDRYLEVRKTERDDYRYRSLAANLQWSALELSILIRKRLEGLGDFVSDKELSPIDRLEEVFESSDLQLPKLIEMRVGGNVLSLSFFKYILRHTFWRPRDVMFYMAAVLANRKYAQKHKKNLDHALVKEIVARTTYDVIDTEFMKEYQNSIRNIRSIVEAFDSSKIVISFDDFESLVSRVPFVVSGGLHRVDDSLEKLDLLYEIGFLGVVMNSKQMRSSADCKDMFVFSDGMKRYSAISGEAKKRSEFVIHPIFCEYLSLDSDVGRIVCTYSDDYIERNDVLHE